ncbi:hypothetical protein BARBAKC583_0139 [Bartonella bacilliformis KC583]|uniref:Uncharacterized protein n=1 Tax=Bartonella bacilliformis (strain ATCC 35685 / KC583 / Herrer 020/F12,63) TaxID=360095 RepID=A1UR74_BARBK|nr:hypothetical protein BARBAKC583_0139 [Bartonella bacilliformis KC583]
MSMRLSKMKEPIVSLIMKCLIHYSRDNAVSMGQEKTV